MVGFRNFAKTPKKEPTMGTAEEVNTLTYLLHGAESFLRS
jgi:hypothetical protein